MPQVYMPAKQIIELAQKNSQVRVHNGKVILIARESRDSSITLIGYIHGGNVVSTDATLIEQHYSGDDQQSVIATEDDELINFLNSQLYEVV